MMYRPLIILVLLLLLIACGATPEVEPPVTPDTEFVAVDPPTVTPIATQPPAEEPPAPTPTAMEEEQAEPPTPTATVEAEPTETPQPEEPTPTESASEPTPTTEPTSTPEPEPPAVQAGGAVSFGNSLATADKVMLALTGVAAPPGDQAYQGWLISDDGSVTSVGTLSVNTDGSVALEWNSPNSENLLSRYTRFQVTLEPAAGSDSPTGQVILAGGLEGDALANARRLFIKNESEPATPLNTAFALGLIAQTDVAVQHVQNATNAAAIGALPEMRTHLEHVVNIIEGAAGSRFGDHDGNGNAENPGDGFGVVGYAGQIGTLFNNQAVGEAVANVQGQSAAIQDKALEIITIEDMGTATAQLGGLKNMADQLRADAVARLYQAAQNAVGFEVAAVE